MCSWWWAEEPPETCTAIVKINKLKKYCILLAVICNYLVKYLMSGFCRIDQFLPTN
jgi:hypothetical protein